MTRFYIVAVGVILEVPILVGAWWAPTWLSFLAYIGLGAIVALIAFAAYRATPPVRADIESLHWEEYGNPEEGEVVEEAGEAGGNNNEQGLW